MLQSVRLSALAQSLRVTRGVPKWRLGGDPTKRCWCKVRRISSDRGSGRGWESERGDRENGRKGLFDWGFSFAQLQSTKLSKDQFEKFAKEQFPWLEKAEKALDTATLYFKDVPDISLFKLAQVLQIEFRASQKLAMDQRLTEEEFEEAGAEPVSKQMFESITDLCYLSDLAYESPQSLRESLGKMNYELLQWEPDVDLEEPAYYIAFDEEAKRVVVTIKGTNTLEDVMTDALHTPEEFMPNVYAHSGIAGSAKFILKRILPSVQHLFVPLGYDITITGHSLVSSTHIVRNMQDCRAKTVLVQGGGRL